MLNFTGFGQWDRLRGECQRQRHPGQQQQQLHYQRRFQQFGQRGGGRQLHGHDQRDGHETALNVPSLSSGGTATVSVTVLGHSSPQLSIVSGNNQTVITGGTVAAVLSLSDPGANVSPLDVSGLAGLSGGTGSAMVPAGGSATYSGVLNAGSIGPSQTQSLSLNAGDQQLLPGHNGLSTLSQTFTLNVLNHSCPQLCILSGNNQTVITGGTVAAVLGLSDPGANVSPLDVGGLAGLSGGTGSAMVPAGCSATYSGVLNIGSIGPSQTQSFSLQAGDQQSLPGASGLGALSQTFTLSVLDHAAPSTSGSGLDLGTVHAGYAAAITSAGSLGVTNGTSGDLRANLYGTAAAGSNNVSLTPLGTIGCGIQPGGTAAVQAVLATGTSGGTVLDQSMTYTFGDASSLPGASTNVGTATINITGQVYSGLMVWSGSGGRRTGAPATTGTTRQRGRSRGPGPGSEFYGRRYGDFRHTPAAAARSTSTGPIPA